MKVFLLILTLFPLSTYVDAWYSTAVLKLWGKTWNADIFIIGFIILIWPFIIKAIINWIKETLSILKVKLYIRKNIKLSKGLYRIDNDLTMKGKLDNWWEYGKWELDGKACLFIKKNIEWSNKDAYVYELTSMWLNKGKFLHELFYIFSPQTQLFNWAAVENLGLDNKIPNEKYIKYVTGFIFNSRINAYLKKYYSSLIIGVKDENNISSFFSVNSVFTGIRLSDWSAYWIKEKEEKERLLPIILKK